MTNENTVTLFPCKDAVVDGCPNDTSAPDTHCADCHLFHEEMAATKTLLADDSWKPVDTLPAPPSEIALGFEVVEFKGDVDNLPVIVHVEKESDLLIVEDTKPDLDSVCYTMNAAEIDCQAALFQIADIIRNLNKTLNDFDNAFEIMDSNAERVEAN